MRKKIVTIAAGLIISLSLTLTPSLAAEKYKYKYNQNTNKVELVPKSWTQKYNSIESRWEWAGPNARLVYDSMTGHYRYIPGYPSPWSDTTCNGLSCPR